MAQARPEQAAPVADFHALATEVAGMRQELAALRRTVADLVTALAGAPALNQAPTEPPPEAAPGALGEALREARGEAPIGAAARNLAESSLAGSSLAGSAPLAGDRGGARVRFNPPDGQAGLGRPTLEGQEAGAGSGEGARAANARSIGAGPSALLARRNAERLAGGGQRRTALGNDPQEDTELDLLIDRLHDLALTKSPGA